MSNSNSTSIMYNLNVEGIVIVIEWVIVSQVIVLIIVIYNHNIERIIVIVISIDL